MIERVSPEPHTRFPVLVLLVVALHVFPLGSFFNINSFWNLFYSILFSVLIKSSSLILAAVQVGHLVVC